LNIGERYELAGVIYTARDAAHKRFVEAINAGESLPIEVKDCSIFYTGPCPPRPGMAIGSIGATTSSRMDPYVEDMLKAGMKVMIGKGTRDPMIAQLCKKYKAVYLLVYGGAAALYSKAVKKAAVVCYEDLGTEAVRRLEVEGFKVIVGTDTRGRVLQDECQKDYVR
jgi:fumarate hydratase subunit beta